MNLNKQQQQNTEAFQNKVVTFYQFCTVFYRSVKVSYYKNHAFFLQISSMYPLPYSLNSQVIPLKINSIALYN